MRTEILYGIHPVIEAFKAARRHFQGIYLEKGSTSYRLQSIRSIARIHGVMVSEVSADQLTSMAGTDSHQGVAARVSRFRCTDFSRVMETAGHSERTPLLALDNIADPHNLGAVLRTALCTGAGAVLIPKDRSAPPTPAVSKISAGAMEHTRLVQVTNLARSLEALKSRGFWIVGLDQDAELKMYGVDLDMPLVLVVGGEEKGIRPLVRKACDMLVSIPQTGPLNSLNASVAAAIALYEICRQRTASGQTRPRAV